MSSDNKQVPQPKQNQRIVGIDGFRAVSILLVLIGHGIDTLPSDSAILALSPFIGNSFLGVTSFFVISGFLITYLLRKEWESSGLIHLGKFYARRVLRIFPAFYTYLLAVTLLRWIEAITTTYYDIGISAIFLTNYKHFFSLPTNRDFWFVGHFWTLSLEEQFYLFWPIIFSFLGIRRAAYIAGGIIIVSPFVRLITYYVWPDLRGQLGVMLHTAADPLMIGCLAALLQGEPWFERLIKRFTGGFWILLASVFLFVASPWIASHLRGSYMSTIGISLNGLAVAYLLLWGIRNPESYLIRMLSTPVLCHIGVLSYSLYLWQQLFLTSNNTSWSGIFPVNFLVAFIVAECSYWIIERPFLRLRSNYRNSQPVPSKA